MLNDLLWIAKNRAWPPDDADERSRRAEHAMNRKLYSELHEEIFPRYAAYLRDKAFDDKKQKIILGWGETATTNYMDLLLGEEPDIEAPKVYHRPDEEVFIDASRYGLGLYEVSQDGINVTNPENVYLVTDPGNIRRVTAYIIFQEFSQGDQKYIKFTIHQAGSIQHLVYSVKNDKLQDPQPLASFVAFKGLQVNSEGIQKTGVDECLIVRVDNALSSERYYGRSDYTPAVHSLIESLELAFARRAEVLAKFSRPIPMVPESAMKFNHAKQQWEFKTDKAMIIEEGESRAEFLTWQADLVAVEHEIEQTMTQLLVKLKLSKVLLAGENEGQAESGTALRIRLIPTLSKVRKFATALKTAVPQVLSLKSKLDVALQVPEAEAFEPEDVQITLKDGIPSNPAEDAQIRLTNAQAISALKVSEMIDAKTALRASILMDILDPRALIPLDDAEVEEAIDVITRGTMEASHPLNQL